MVISKLVFNNNGYYAVDELRRSDVKPSLCSKTFRQAIEQVFKLEFVLLIFGRHMERTANMARSTQLLDKQQVM